MTRPTSEKPTPLEADVVLLFDYDGNNFVQVGKCPTCGSTHVPWFVGRTKRSRSKPVHKRIPILCKSSAEMNGTVVAIIGPLEDVRRGY